MKRLFCLLVVSLIVAGTLTVPAQARGRIGAGAEYMKTLGDIKDTEEFDPDAVAFLGSYQMDLELFKVEGDVEFVLDFGGSGKALILPQAYALLGDFVYGGVGIGTVTFDGEWASDPFYALRAGVNLGLDSMEVDVYGLYRFLDTDVFEDFGDQNLDSITFCAQVRF